MKSLDERVLARLRVDECEEDPHHVYFNKGDGYQRNDLGKKRRKKIYYRYKYGDGQGYLRWVPKNGNGDWEPVYSKRFCNLLRLAAWPKHILPEE